MFVEARVEIEARRNAEAVERRPQQRHIDVRRADHDGHLAEGPAGRGLLQNAARDLVGFALHVGRAHQRHGRRGPHARQASWRKPNASNRARSGGAEVALVERQGEIGVPAERRR